MKILIGHNYYRSVAPSGEDVAVRNERGLLERAGIEVVPFEMHSDDIETDQVSDRLRVAARTIWSIDAKRSLAAVLDRHKPHIAHFHNTFPQLSPSVYKACQQARVPVVQTLHNYRLICPGALLLREGRPCENCVGTTLLPALRHRCYRQSLPATGALVAMLTFNRANGSYSSGVDQYVALTKFAAGRFVAGGLPADKITVKPNFLVDPPAAGGGSGGYAVFVGRLGHEKGIMTMVRAWESVAGIPLKVIGDGEMRSALEEYLADHRLPVTLMGHRDRAEVLEIVANARMQIVPSECYEGFPLVILEAFATGTPIVASRLGSLDEIVEDNVTGTKFTPGRPAELSDAVQRLDRLIGAAPDLRRRVRQEFDQHYTPELNIERLLGIYQRLLSGGAEGC